MVDPLLLITRASPGGMKGQLLAALAVLLAASCAETAEASGLGSRSELDAWAARAQHRLEQATPAGRADDARAHMLADSLGMHVRARELLHDTDLPLSMLSKFHGGLDAHARVVDKATAALSSSAQAQEDQIAFLRSVKNAEASLARQYYAALQSGVLPPPRPKLGVMQAALLKATGIDATQDEDGKLFNVMVEHFGGKPPAAALGVSAKFFSDGRQLMGRYHVGLRLPCATAATDAAQLAASSHKAAAALSAPGIVHAWIDAVGDARVGLGFGFAMLDASGKKKGGKVYVMNRAGEVMPPLPLSLGVLSKPITIYESIPLLKPKEGSVEHPHWLDSQMVSLEWQIGDDRVVLRHYFAERGVTSEQRIRSSGSQADAGLSTLVINAGAKTETVAYTAPFRVVQGAVTEAPAIVGSKVRMPLVDCTESSKILQNHLVLARGGIAAARDSCGGCCGGDTHTHTHTHTHAHTLTHTHKHTHTHTLTLGHLCRWECNFPTAPCRMPASCQ